MKLISSNSNSSETKLTVIIYMTGSKRQEDRLNKCAYITCRNPPLFLLADKPSIKQHTEEKL